MLEFSSMREFFSGGQDVQQARKTIKQLGTRRTSGIQKERLEQARQIARRHFLKLTGLGIGAAVFGCGGITWLITSRPRSESLPYQDWGIYQNALLPTDLVIAIGEDIKNSVEFLGFPEVGEIILLSSQRPDRLHELLPELIDHGPLGIRLTNLVEKEGANGALNHKIAATALRARVRNRATRETREGIFAQVNRLQLVVELDNSFYLAPKVAKQLILVKEFSHFLYFGEHKKVISVDVLQNFDILEPSSILGLENFLLINGYAKPSLAGIPSLGDKFDNARVDIDGAGYWHIMAAFGKMKVNGLLSATDLQVLWSNDLAFERARSSGLLIEKSRGEFVWREEITPFSQEWLSIIRPILK